ncbi:YIP1 family protein [candidate division WOR-3 bacterium]|nr:YIP1 family protein [candidate division WOR-3 bacterium]
MLTKVNKCTTNTGKFSSFWVGTIVSPRKTFKQILQEESVWFGFVSFLLYGLLYAITEIFLVINHLRPTMPPFLPISEESYYFWQLLFGIPVGLLGWVILGWVAYFMTTKLFKANGSLRNYLNVLGFSFSVPCIITMWIPETIIAVFCPEWWGNPPAGTMLWADIYIWLGLGWTFALSVLAIKQASSTSWFKSALTASISIIVMMTFIIIFIR